jgi:Zn-dependent protease with chaperone function
MTIGAAIVLIAVGAVLKWAVTAHVSGFDIQTAGTIIFIVGLLGLVLSIMYTFWFSRDTRSPYHDETAVRRRGPGGGPPPEY